MLAVDLANPDLSRRRQAPASPAPCVHIRAASRSARTRCSRASSSGTTAGRRRASASTSISTPISPISSRCAARCAPRRGVLLPEEWRPDGAVLRLSRPGRGRAADAPRLRSAAADPASAHRASWPIDLAAGRHSGCISMCDAMRARRTASAERRTRDARRQPRGAERRIAERRAARRPSSPAATRASTTGCERSRADLDMLITETPQGPYPYAGIPWFSTVFGRDGMITALAMPVARPGARRRACLRYLAANQATELDPTADAEPGKILHETRERRDGGAGRGARSRRYYGSVDSTPLFVAAGRRLFRAHRRPRADPADLARTSQAALGWMRRLRRSRWRRLRRI